MRNRKAIRVDNNIFFEKMKKLKFAFVLLFLTKLCFSQSETTKSIFNKDSLIVIYSENKNWTQVKELINSGLSCNINYQGNTPLIWASFYGDIEMVKYLLSKGADPNFGSNRTPMSVSDKGCLEWFNEECHPDIVDILVLNALTKTYIINGIKKNLSFKPTMVEINTAIFDATSKFTMEEKMYADKIGIIIKKVIVEDPVKQIIKVYTDTFIY